MQEMKIIRIGLVVLFSAFYTAAKPGGTYTLTGDEKGLSEIIKADMKKFPDLYKGESLYSYTLKFKRENKLGKRKLAPGDSLRFPETLASIKAKKKPQREEKADPVNNNEARNKQIYAFQHKFLPQRLHEANSAFFSELPLGAESKLFRMAEQQVDARFAQELKITIVEENQVYALTFQAPFRSPLCYHALIIKAEDTYFYYTLEKGIDLFGTGNPSVLCQWTKEGVHLNSGPREYDDLDSFIKDVLPPKKG